MCDSLGHDKVANEANDSATAKSANDSATAKSANDSAIAQTANGSHVNSSHVNYLLHCTMLHCTMPQRSMAGGQGLAVPGPDYGGSAQKFFFKISSSSLQNI